MDVNTAGDDGVATAQQQLGRMKNSDTSFQTDDHDGISFSLLNFYSPDALPHAQPTMSKHTGITLLLVIKQCIVIKQH